MCAPLDKRLLLRPEDVPATDAAWEVVSVFNPGAVEYNGEIVLMVRVAERPREERPGWTPLPRWEIGQGPVVDWFPVEQTDPIDPRVTRIRSSGRTRLTFVSHLRMAHCGDGLSEPRLSDVRFDPSGPLEEFGVEDPRITPIDGRYWITYVAVSRHGAATALASTSDFREFTRHGVIFPPENKDVVLFPERVDGNYVAQHRPNGATPFTTPEMWLAHSSDLLQWGGHQPLSIATTGWTSGRVGAGTPPIRFDEGWLEIFHGNRRPMRSGEVGCYQAAALLLAADDPSRIVKQTEEPILAPTESFERNGFVDDVVFPTGIVEREDALLVYYGAGDACTALVSMPRQWLRDQLRPMNSG